MTSFHIFVHKLHIFVHKGVGVLISDVLLLVELSKFLPAAYLTMPLLGNVLDFYQNSLAQRIRMLANFGHVYYFFN